MVQPQSYCMHIIGAIYGRTGTASARLSSIRPMTDYSSRLFFTTN